MKPTLIFLIALCMYTAVRAGTLETIQIDVGGEERQFTLFTPSSYDPGVQMPLVFGLHGYTVSSSTHQRLTAMDEVAEDKGVLVVYPQAIDNNWFPDHVPGNNIDYLLGVYDATVAKRNVNKEIVGLSGLSQGAAMSMTLAAAEPNLFSSVVSVAGTRFFTEDDELVPINVPEVPDRLISRLHVHGTGDTLAPIDGGQVLDFPLFSHSVLDSVSTWAAGLGSEGEPIVVAIDDLAADGLTSDLYAWQGRAYMDIQGNQYTADTKYVRVLGGGHNWPGDWDGWPSQFGPVTRDFSTSEMAIDFILSHPREAVAGDFDADGDVDGADFLTWQREDRTPAGLALWKANYGGNNNSTLQSSLSEVPEPATLWLLLTSAAWCRPTRLTRGPSISIVR